MTIGTLMPRDAAAGRVATADQPGADDAGAASAAPQAVTLTARAKVNLALHVTGRRDDGYHLLDSIVAFADLEGVGGDRLTIRFAAGETGPPRLAVSGPFAGLVPQDATNSAVAAAVSVGGIAAIALEKNLPVAAGVGGGSADAAAVLRAAAAHRGLPAEDVAALALSLGADVPVCLLGRPARMRGIGEALTPLSVPGAPCVLANPGVEMSTPAVFKALTQRDNPPLPAWTEPRDAAALAAWLAQTRNDLAAPAETIAPGIAEAVAALVALPGCLLSRMSGSGATVFGLFADTAARDAAAAALAARRPQWWVRSATIG